MRYIVWTKGDYEDWKKVECADGEEAKSAILEATKAGKEPFLTAVVPFDVNVSLGDAKDVEVPAGEKPPKVVKAEPPKEVKSEA